jgi:hypothetical protein
VTAQTKLQPPWSSAGLAGKVDGVRPKTSALWRTPEDQGVTRAATWESELDELRKVELLETPMPRAEALGAPADVGDDGPTGGPHGRSAATMLEADLGAHCADCGHEPTAAEPERIAAW